MFANFIGVPRLGHQLAQAAHDLVALVVGQIVVIELAEAGVDLHQLVDQGAAGDLRRVRRQHQLDGKLRHRVLQLFVAELLSLRRLNSCASASGLLAASPLGEMLWYCSATLVRLRNWLKARATGSNSSLDRFCRVESSSAMRFVAGA